MRTTKELLQLMLNHIRWMGGFGLCALIWELYREGLISFEEEKILIRYLKENRPKNLRTYFKSPWYWTQGRQRPRIKWLKKHIKILSTK